VELSGRFTDFQVNEIGPDGKVVHLQDTAAPRQQKRAGRAEVKAEENPTGEDEKPTEGQNPIADKNALEGDKVAETSDASEATPKPPSTESKPGLPPVDGDVAPLAALAGDEFAQALVAMYAALGDASAKPPAAAARPKTAVISDKPARSQIHALVRTLFRSRIDTVTDGDGAIVAAPKSAGGGQFHTNPQSHRRNDRRQRDNNAPDAAAAATPRGEYLHFTLFKENRDTLDAVSHLARVLRVKPASLGTAGTKDRRAATAQRCSLRHGRADALARTNGRIFGVMVGDFEHAARPVHLGAHQGNEFVIVAKQCRLLDDGEQGRPVAERVEATRRRVQAALDHAAAHGWINYFGHQRFGTHTTGTHEVGTLILKGDFGGAVAAILYHPPADDSGVDVDGLPPSARDAHNRNRACAMFAASPDRAEEVLALLPRRFAAETAVMRHLARPGSARDHAGAVTSITRGLRTMYLHAYQSLVWNHAASRRWELYGARVVEGDLVLDDGKGSGGEGQAAPVEDDQPVYVDEGAEGDVDDGTVPARARALSAEEAASGAYTIFDVVLPTPGTDVAYPTNEIGEFYTAFMAAHGGLDPLAMRRPQREFSLGGRYRALLGRFLPGGEGEEGTTPRCEVRAYARDDEQMHPTDADRLRAARRGGGPQQQQQQQQQQRKRGREGAKGDDDAVGTKRARVEGDAMVVDPDGEGKPEAADEAGKMDVAEEEGAQPTGEDAASRPAEGKKEEEGLAEVGHGDGDGADKVAVVVSFRLGKSAYATVVLRELMGDARAGAAGEGGDGAAEAS
jgi:tRNA pseudouridine13 synthase